MSTHRISTHVTHGTVADVDAVDAVGTAADVGTRRARGPRPAVGCPRGT